MASEAVKQLITAEENLAEKVENARVEAKKICENAVFSGKNLLDSTEEFCIKAEADILAKARSRAEEENKRISAEAEADRERLTALASGKMSEAAALITERVVNG